MMSDFKEYLLNDEFSYNLLDALNTHGVNSGLYMPCVTYYDARKWFKQNEETYELYADWYDSIGEPIPHAANINQLYCNVYSWIVMEYANEVFNLVEKTSLQKVFDDMDIEDTYTELELENLAELDIF